jgi:hypothetical protein
LFIKLFNYANGGARFFLQFFLFCKSGKVFVGVEKKIIEKRQFFKIFLLKKTFDKITNIHYQKNHGTVG